MTVANTSALPSYEAMSNKGQMPRVHYQFLADLWKGKPQGSVKSITVGASPFTYQATSKGFMIVQGGTVSLIQFTRDGVNNFTTGLTTGIVPLSLNDSIIVTWSGKPTMTWVPQ